MSYRIQLEAGETWRKFPNGEFAFRATDYMAAARGTLTSGSGEGSCGTYVQDTQKVALSNWSTTVKWNNTSPYYDMANVSPTLEIPLAQYPVIMQGADYATNQHAYRLYASCRWPGEAAGDGFRDNTFYTHGDTVTQLWGQGKPLVSQPPYQSIQFISGGAVDYHANKSHYTVQYLGRFVIWSDAAGDNYEEDKIMQIYMASRETESGTITPRIDQIMLLPVRYTGTLKDWPSTAADPFVDKFEEHSKTDNDFNGIWTSSQWLTNQSDVVDYQEASSSDDAEFSAGINVVGTSDDVGKFYKAWVVAGINNWDEKNVVVEDFSNVGDPDGPDPSGNGWPYPGFTGDDKYWWNRRIDGLVPERDTIVPCKYAIDGSIFYAMTISQIWTGIGGGGFYIATNLTAHVGGAFQTLNADYGNGQPIEGSTTYNYQRNVGAKLGIVPDWQVSAKTSWDIVPSGPENLFASGIHLGNTDPSVNGMYFFAAEMDETGTCWARLRFQLLSSSDYATVGTDATNDYVPYGGNGPAVRLHGSSDILGEIDLTYTPDLADFINLKMWRTGYRIRCKAWLEGDSEPDWQIDVHQYKTEVDDGQSNANFPTGKALLLYPYFPNTGKEARLPQLKSDFCLPGIRVWVDTLDAKYWDYPGPNVPANVGFPQSVEEPITANFEDFHVDYVNPGDPVDCNIRFYDFDTDEPLGDTVNLPKGAQYLVFVQDHGAEDYNATYSTAGFPFRAKMWNENGASPLQSCVIRDVIINWITHNPIHLDLRFRPYEEPDLNSDEEEA